MKKEELKILAKWYGNIALNLLRNKSWSPDINSNQLELLKKKFLDEANIKRIEYDMVMNNKGTNWMATYYKDVEQDYLIRSIGKNIQTADLNAILHYINRSK